MKKIKIAFKKDSNPLFADEVMVGVIVKTRKINGNVEKEGYIRLGFIDMAKRQVFAEIVLSKITAMALLKILKQNLEKLEKELKSKKIQKFAIETSKTELNYIG